TPTAMNGFFDTAAVAAATGRPIRSAWRRPGDPRPFPDPDAVVVAPATFNTINKWASGISDTLALGLLCEAIGMALPVVVLPYLNAAQGKHPALAESIQRLRGYGVQVLFGPDVLPLHRPREGRRELFPWQLTLAALDAS
ncbi:MAG: flavoprotein, partial [Actinomycetes bacterium]